LIRVLYVDDEQGLLEIAKSFLELSGDMVVDTAISPKEAVDVLEASSYDAIVSDYQMPEMDGIEFLSLLRSQGEKIPFILFTGKGREEVVIKALNCGADFYLQKGGEPTSLFKELEHVVRDAVKHRESEEALKSSEAKYRNLFNHLGEAVGIYRYIVDDNDDVVDFAYVDLNPTLWRVLGKSEEEVNGRSVGQVFGADNLEQYLPTLNRMRKENREIETEEYFPPVKGYFKTIWVPLSRDLFIASSLDITDRRRAEEELVQANKLMSYIIEHSPSGIAVFDRDLRYLYASTQFFKEYNVAEKDLIGKKHYEVFPDLPQKIREVHQRALSGEVLSAESDPFVREDGTTYWTRWECRPWSRGDGSIGGIILYSEVVNQHRMLRDGVGDEWDSRDCQESVEGP